MSHNASVKLLHPAKTTKIVKALRTEQTRFFPTVFGQPDEPHSVLFRLSGDTVIKWFTFLSRDICYAERIPLSWGDLMTVPIFKRGDTR